MTKRSAPRRSTPDAIEPGAGTGPDAVPRVDEILDRYRPLIGGDFDGYRNHVQRMVHVCFALADAGTDPDVAPSPLTPDEREKIIVGGCFHDIGLWTADTFDYLEPSVERALDYLKGIGRLDWADDVAMMIREHHRLTRSRGGGLAELFRRGDLVDFSLGVRRFGLPRSLVRSLKARFPNRGFHRGLARRAVPWLLRHPLRPAPMVKW